MESAINILRQIEQDKIEAEKYLLSAAKDGSRYSRAVEIVEHELTQTEKCLLAARREIEKSRKYRSRRHWVIKTQFIYNRLAEEKNLSCTWISESKIKRQWLHYVSLVAEIAIRLDDVQK
jgi:hypothetical protein